MMMNENFGYEGFSFLMCWRIPDKREKSIANGYWSPECDLVSATYTQSREHSFNFSAEQLGRMISSGQGFSGFFFFKKGNTLEEEDRHSPFHSSSSENTERMQVAQFKSGHAQSSTRVTSS